MGLICSKPTKPTLKHNKKGKRGEEKVSTKEKRSSLPQNEGLGDDLSVPSAEGLVYGEPNKPTPKHNNKGKRGEEKVSTKEKRSSLPQDEELGDDLSVPAAEGLIYGDWLQCTKTLGRIRLKKGENSLRNVKFENCPTDGLTFINCQWENVLIHDCKFRGTTFRNVKFVNTVLYDLEFNNVTIFALEMRGLFWRELRLENALLSKAQMKKQSSNPEEKGVKVTVPRPSSSKTIYKWITGKSMSARQLQRIKEGNRMCKYAPNKICWRANPRSMFKKTIILGPDRISDQFMKLCFPGSGIQIREYPGHWNPQWFQSADKVYEVTDRNTLSKTRNLHYTAYFGTQPFEGSNFCELFCDGKVRPYCGFATGLLQVNKEIGAKALERLYERTFHFKTSAQGVKEFLTAHKKQAKLIKGLELSYHFKNEPEPIETSDKAWHELMCFIRHEASFIPLIHLHIGRGFWEIAAWRHERYEEVPSIVIGQRNLHNEVYTEFQTNFLYEIAKIAAPCERSSRNIRCVDGTRLEISIEQTEGDRRKEFVERLLRTIDLRRRNRPLFREAHANIEHVAATGEITCAWHVILNLHIYSKSLPPSNNNNNLTHLSSFKPPTNFRQNREMSSTRGGRGSWRGGRGNSKGGIRSAALLRPLIPLFNCSISSMQLPPPHDTKHKFCKRGNFKVPLTISHPAVSLVRRYEKEFSITNVHFKDCEQHQLELEYCEWKNVTFIDCKFSNVAFRIVKLLNVTFNRVNFSNTALCALDFEDVTISRVSFLDDLWKDLRISHASIVKQNFVKDSSHQEWFKWTLQVKITGSSRTSVGSIPITSSMRMRDCKTAEYEDYKLWRRQICSFNKHDNEGNELLTRLAQHKDIWDRFLKFCIPGPTIHIGASDSDTRVFDPRRCKPLTNKKPEDVPQESVDNCLSLLRLNRKFKKLGETRLNRWTLYFRCRAARAATFLKSNEKRLRCVQEAVLYFNWTSDEVGFGTGIALVRLFQDLRHRYAFIPRVKVHMGEQFWSIVPWQKGPQRAFVACGFLIDLAKLAAPAKRWLSFEDKRDKVPPFEHGTVLEVFIEGAVTDEKADFVRRLTRLIENERLQRPLFVKTKNEERVYKVSADF
ncbi:hypothetical protein Q7P37_000185 [Cladosporium fusiforme]